MARAVPKADIGQILRQADRNAPALKGHAPHAGRVPEDASEQSPQETDQPPMGSNADVPEIDILRQENSELREHAEELERLLNEKAPPSNDQQKEMEALLEEKSDVIRQLHLKIQELQANPAAAAPEGADPSIQQESKSELIDQLQQQVEELQAKPAPATPREEELLALHEELEEERRQLKEDEESLMQQMRQMEVQMSRERAEMARQRSELQRLHNDIRHELELASREAELRDRLQPLQRRHQEMTHRKGAEPIREAAPAPTPAPAPSLRQNGTPPQKPGARDKSGLFKRLFGG
jgi:chromosome segregation ATPase